MKNLSFCLLFFCLFFSPNLFSQVKHTINFSSEKLSLSGFTGSDNINYIKVKYNDIQRIDEAGMPELPVRFVNLIIPSGQKVKDINLSSSNKQVFNITNLVYPVQPDIPTSIYSEEIEFVKPNSEIYKSEDPYPSRIVQLAQDGYFDGQNHIVTLAVYPVQYIPKMNQLIFYSEIDISLVMEATTPPNLTVRNRKHSNQSIYDNILQSIVENPQDISLYQVKPMQFSSFGKTNSIATVNFYEYVVITTNALKNSFDKLVEWKKRKGIDIGVVTTEEIYADYTGDLISGINDNAGKIRQYLSDAYQEGTIWALLGGDNTVVPIRYGCGQNCDSWNYSCCNPPNCNPPCYDIDTYKIPADLYFADFNGDWDVDSDEFYGQPTGDDPDYNPEIFVGRLLCSSSTGSQDISNWTEKLIRYEQNPGEGDNSYLTGSFMTVSDHMLDWYNPNQAEQVADVLPNSFNSTIWEELPSGASTSPTFPLGAEVVTEMNNHYGLYSWFNHGAPTTISVMSVGLNQGPWWLVTTTDAINEGESETGNGLDNLTNEKYPSICYSIGCENVPFDVFDNCNWHTGRNMAQGFTVITKSGGPAFLGNSRYGWVSSS